MAKEVTDREGATTIVASAADAHADHIEQAFLERYGAHLTKKEATGPLTLSLTVKVIGRALRGACNTLVQASDAHDAELADDAEPRETRDASAAALTSTLVGYRGTLETVYGAAGSKLVGFDGRVPTDPKQVLAVARKVRTELRKPKLKWPKPVTAGVKIDVTHWAAALDAPIATLEAAQKDIAREAREAQVTIDAKSKAMDANDEVFKRGAELISAALYVVGDDEHAARVRPSARRPGRTLADDPGQNGGPPLTPPAGPTPKVP